MPAEPRNPLADVMSLLALPAQQIANVGKTVESFRTGVTGFLEAVQTFRTTMDQLNAMATRMNRLLEDVEEPIRTLTPQMTKAAQRADRLMDAMTEPIDKLLPQLSRLADTMASPAMRDLPREVTDLVAALSDLPKQLAPLARFAQSAGGMFGFPGFGALGTSARSAVLRPESSPPASDGARTGRSAATTSSPKRTAATKKSSAKKASAKKASAKKASAKKASAKKASRPSVAGRSPTATAPRVADTFRRSAAKRAT
jgi:hypothetical protein